MAASRSFFMERLCSPNRNSDKSSLCILGIDAVHTGQPAPVLLMKGGTEQSEAIRP
jgi:hypothetical protein